MEFNEVKQEFRYLYEIWFADCARDNHILKFYLNLGGYLCRTCGRMTVTTQFIEWFNQFKAIGECIDQGHNVVRDIEQQCFVCINCNDHIDELVLARGPMKSLELIDKIRASTV